MTDSLPEFTVYPRLKGKYALVTGASSGIGYYTATHLAACGCNLIITARRTEKLVTLQKELESRYGVQVFAYTLDVRDKDSVSAFYAAIPESFKEVDILVNNAGLALKRDLTWEASWEDVEQMMDTNIKGVLLMIRLFVPDMLKRGRGHIINVGSVAGHETYIGGSAYCGTKHMVEAINHTLRQELVSSPLRVTLVSPGLVETEFSLVRFSGDKDLAAKPYENCEPLKGEDVADCIAWAASRPAHVQVADVLVFATCQSTATTIHRK